MCRHTQVTVETTTTVQKVREHDYERRMPLLSTSLMRQRYEFARRMLKWSWDYTVVVSERWFPEENVAQQVLTLALTLLTLTLTLPTLTLTRAQTRSFVNWRVSFRIFTNPNPNPAGDSRGALRL